MADKPGLRERKRQRTHQTISAAAIALFLERGYDNVSIAEIADAAEVSRRTLFAYFPTKDDLVLHRFADHEDEPARTVRDRGPNQSPLDALHEQRRLALMARDPITGINDTPEIVAFYHLVIATPALLSALQRFTRSSQKALAAALREATTDEHESTATLAAAQVTAVHQTLSEANHLRVAAGQSADHLEPHALAELDQAYAMLRGGLYPYR
ncbi:TetR family transcriptional regulator [Kibdelosporangium lantanae]